MRTNRIATDNAFILPPCIILGSRTHTRARSDASLPPMEWDRVSSVTAEEIPVDGVFVVSIAEKAQDHESGSYLILQAPLDEPSEDHRATGTDSYCLVHDNGGICYGGVERVEMATGGQLVMSFDEYASSELGLESGELRLTLDLEPGDREKLASGLRRVLCYGDPRQHPALVGV